MNFEKLLIHEFSNLKSINKLSRQYLEEKTSCKKHLKICSRIFKTKL